MLINFICSSVIDTRKHQIMKIQLQSIARSQNDDGAREEVFAAHVTIADGLQGDRSDLLGGGEVAVLSKESWVKVCHETGQERPWLDHGSSLLIKGFEFLPTDLGKRLQIGEAEFEIHREMFPHDKLENQAPELFRSLQMGFRGGVVCKVLRSGSIQCGDGVIIA